jgi:hypothetical protein
MNMFNKIGKAVKDTSKAVKDTTVAVAKVQTAPAQVAGRVIKGERPDKAFKNTATDVLGSVDKASASTRVATGAKKK